MSYGLVLKKYVVQKWVGKYNQNLNFLSDKAGQEPSFWKCQL